MIYTGWKIAATMPHLESPTIWGLPTGECRPRDLDCNLRAISAGDLFASYEDDLVQTDPRLALEGEDEIQAPLPKPPAVRTVAASPMCPAEWNRAMPLNSAARGRPGNIFTIISVRTPKAPSAAARSTTSAVTE